MFDNFRRGEKGKDTDKDRQIFDTRIRIRTLIQKVSGNLKAELAVARELKKTGRKNSENYSRIGINYYLLQVLQKADDRLTSIESTNDLNVMMGSLGSVISSVNSLGKTQRKTNTSPVFAGIERLNKTKEKEKGSLQNILRELEKISSPSSETDDLFDLPGLDVIESLINGTGVSENPVRESLEKENPVREHMEEDILSQIYEASEKMPEETAKKSQGSGMKETDVKKMIDNL